MRADAFTFLKEDIYDRDTMAALFAEYSFDVVVNLAAQAGVRYSLENLNAYVDSNLVGFVNILEGCRHSSKALSLRVFIVGLWHERQAAFQCRRSKLIIPYRCMRQLKFNELMAHTYSHLFNIPMTGLRFFTGCGLMVNRYGLL